MLRVAIATLGCRVNRSDGDVLVQRLSGALRVVAFEDIADIYLINSCTVTAVAERQSRQLVYQARRRNPEAHIYLVGCLAALPASEPAGSLPVDGRFPLSRTSDLVAEIHRVNRTGPRCVDEDAGIATATTPAPGCYGARRRPLLKVQDGCDSACTYCVVPRVRGPCRSRDPGWVRDRLVELGALGIPEIVLAGIHLGRYGQDLHPSLGLPELLANCRGLVPRLRLSSVEPLEVTPALTAQLDLPGLCAHLHVPVQSADDEILAAMNRPYTSALLADLFVGLRRRFPDMALGTDLICGFPGETEQAFERTFRFVQNMPLTYLHVFPYSPRPGTPAANLPGQVPAAEASRRSAALRRLGHEKRLAFAHRFLGRALPVVVEARPGEPLLSGVTDTYQRVFFPGDRDLDRRLIPVRVVELKRNGTLLGQVQSRVPPG